MLGPQGEPKCVLHAGFDLQKLALEKPLEIRSLLGPLPGKKRRRCPWSKSLLEAVRDLQPVTDAE